MNNNATESTEPKSTGDKIVDDAIEIAAKEGRAPEQADFMTAAILNQDNMTPEQRRELQADLRAIEEGTSTESILGGYAYDPEEESDYPWDDDEEYPFTADDEDKEEDYTEEVTLIVYAECPNGWHNWDMGISKTELEAGKQRFVDEHTLNCGCSGEVTFSVDED